MTPPVPYAENAARHARDGEQEAQRSKVIARLRLTTFLVAAAILLWALSSGVTRLPIWTAILMFVAFGFLVVWHARVDERVAWHGALRLVNLRGLSRRARDWQALPEAEAPAGSILPIIRTPSISISSAARRSFNGSVLRPRPVAA